MEKERKKEEKKDRCLAVDERFQGLVTQQARRRITELSETAAILGLGFVSSFIKREALAGLAGKEQRSSLGSIRQAPTPQ
jgi:hypothetical protein